MVDKVNHAWFIVCMTDKQDRLVMLRNRYSSEISKKESELKELRGKLSLIDELESDADKLVPATNGELKFANGKTQLIDATLEAVNTIGNKGISTTKIVKYLKSNGFPIKGKNFPITVGTTLRRLADRQKINTDLKEGKRVFSPKEANENQ